MIPSATNDLPANERDFAEIFSDFSSALTVDRLPASTVDAAKMNLLDTLACGIAGFSAEGIRPLIELASDWGGRAQAPIWCTGIRVPAPLAAWVNGAMAHARDYDDTHDAAIFHAGVSVVPAALAAAGDTDATGSDLLCGIVAGLELICRLGVATEVNLVESGFMYTSLFGHFAATAAASRVLRLDAGQTRNALGIAFSQAAGTLQVIPDAALTKRIQPGFAAKTGVLSAHMARKGITGTRHTFEGSAGLFRSHLRNRFDPALLRNGLGERFVLEELSYKPYPTCRATHAAIDAALIARRDGIDLAAIRRIEVGVNKNAYGVVCTPIEERKHPQTVVQAQFSIPYAVACALVKGRVSLADVTQQALLDPAVRELALKVDCVLDDDIEREWGRAVTPAVMTFFTDTGKHRARVDYPNGHPRSPMSAEDVRQKLASCLAASGLDWPDSTADALRQTVQRLETADSTAGVLAPITLVEPGNPKRAGI